MDDEELGFPMGGALGALQPQAPVSSRDADLAPPPIDTGAKWNAYAAGALKPVTGGFGESFGNALGALSAGQTKEDEMRARYLPLMQAAAQRKQLQEQQMAERQQKMSAAYQQAGINSLVPLLSRQGPDGKPMPIAAVDIDRALAGAIQRGIPEPEVSKLRSALTANTKPGDDLRANTEGLWFSTMRPQDVVSQVQRTDDRDERQRKDNQADATRKAEGDANRAIREENTRLTERGQNLTAQTAREGHKLQADAAKERRYQEWKARQVE